jgi:putative PIN family toxin of toxin-antitoxin system
MKVVIDTNVLVSALMNVNGNPARILALVLNGKIRIVYDNRVIFEYSDVLSRKDFGFDVETIHDMIDFFKAEGEFVNSEHVNMDFIDETDKKFYEVHKSGESAYLITGTIKHFPKEDSIIIPAVFLEKFDAP